MTTATRSDMLPDLPTVGDFVPGYEVSKRVVRHRRAPKNTPPEIVDKLNKEINVLLADPIKKSRVADFGGLPMPPAEFGKLIADETERWGNVIRAANIKAR